MNSLPSETRPEITHEPNNYSDHPTGLYSLQFNPDCSLNSYSTPYSDSTIGSQDSHDACLVQIDSSHSELSINSPDRDFNTELLKCFDSRETTEIINAINDLQTHHIRSSYEITFPSSIANLLENANHWPPPVPNACLFDGCEFVGDSEGTLRVHLHNFHRIDTSAVKDEIATAI